MNNKKNNQSDEIFLEKNLSIQFYDEIIENIFINTKNDKNIINNEELNINKTINYSQNNFKEKKIEFYKTRIDGKKNFDKENYTQYHLYCANLLMKIEKDNILSDFNLKKLNLTILNCFFKRYKCEERTNNDNKIIDFPFISFYSFLNNLKNNELIEFDNLNHLLVNDLFIIYQKVKIDKNLYVFNYQ